MYTVASSPPPDLVGVLVEPFADKVQWGLLSVTDYSLLLGYEYKFGIVV